jgi:hypothetical protein
MNELLPPLVGTLANLPGHVQKVVESYARAAIAINRRAALAARPGSAGDLTDAQRHDLATAAFCIAARGDENVVLQEDDAERILELLLQLSGLDATTLPAPVQGAKHDALQATLAGAKADPDNRRDVEGDVEGVASELYAACSGSTVLWAYQSSEVQARWRRGTTGFTWKANPIAAATNASQALAQQIQLSALSVIREQIVNNNCDGESQFAGGVSAANSNILKRIDHMIEQTRRGCATEFGCRGDL